MSFHIKESCRYVLNGIAATLVHYTVLTINMGLLKLPSAALANLIAAAFGISASFLGSRFFVFRATKDPLLSQAIKFCGLYAAIAALHGLTMFFWTDYYGYDYRVGFLIGTSIQVSFSYLGNKFLVFRTRIGI